MKSDDEHLMFFDQGFDEALRVVRSEIELRIDDSNTPTEHKDALKSILEWINSGVSKWHMSRTKS